jgi:ABC-type multidrug transport system fused ATPase/permease subunit
LYQELTTKPIRKRTIACTIVIVISVFSEAIGLGMIMPLLGSIIEPNKGKDAAEGFFSIFDTLTTIELALVIIILFMLKFFFGVVKNYLMYDVEWRVRSYWVSSVFRMYLYKDYIDYEREKPGVIFNNIVNETLKSASVYRQSMEYLAQILQVLALSIVLLISNFLFAVGALLIVIVILFIIKIAIISKGKELGINRQKIEENISHDVNEMIHGMKTLRFFSGESLLNKRLDLKLRKIIVLMRKTEVIKRLPMQITEISIVSLVVIYIIISSLNDINIAETLPFLGMMLVVSLRLFSNAGSLATNYMSIKVLWPSVLRIYNTINSSKNNAVKNECRSLSTTALENIDSVKFQDVSFGYDNLNFVVKNINIDFYNNAITTIVGKSGSGKSTIIKLLMQLYCPNSGNITVDGVDILDVGHKKWRKIIGYVDQESFFFYGTVRENLTFGYREFSDKDINKALKVSHCSGFISKLSLGLDTVIGDKGNLLSGGQKARLSFARAILRRPKLLILDEVTSGLDSESKIKIIDSLLKIKNDTIIILITHDDLLIEASDYVYKIESEGVVKITDKKI